MPDRDDHLRSFVGVFPIPVDFIDETQARTMAAGKVHRSPTSHDVEVIELGPKDANPNTNRIIEFQRAQAGRATSWPFYVVLMDEPSDLAGFARQREERAFVGA